MPSHIKRIPCKDRYSAIPNTILEDKRLSLKARGLLCYILSKPDNWQTRISHLNTISSHDKARAIGSALKELRNCGYARLVPLRSDDGKHLIGQTYEICETGEFINQSQQKRDRHETLPIRNVTDTKQPPLVKTETAVRTDRSIKTEEKEYLLVSEHIATRSSGTATAFPKIFVITDDMRAWAAQHASHIDLDAETDSMRDWALSKGARKHDWIATWRNWIRRAAKDHTQQTTRTSRAKHNEHDGHRIARYRDGDRYCHDCNRSLTTWEIAQL